MSGAAAEAAAKRQRLGGGLGDATAPLSPGELEQYRTAGWVRLRGAFDTDVAASCCDFMWAHLGEHCGLERGDPGTWRDESRLTGSNGLNKQSQHAVFRGVGSARLLAALQQLNGEELAAPKSFGGFLITFPGHVLGSPHPQPAPWRLPRAGMGTGWHWDGNPASWLDSPSPGVKVFTLFSDIEPRGGGTLLLEGSHRLVDAFFCSLPPSSSLKQNPLKKRFNALHPWIGALTTVPDGVDDSAAEEARIREYMSTGTTVPVAAAGGAAEVRLRVVECCGEAGDAFLVHPSMYHASAANCAAVPRFMRSCTLT